MESPTLAQVARPVHGFQEFCSIAKTDMLGSIDESVQTSLLCTQCQQIRTCLESNVHRLKRGRFLRTRRKFDHHVSGRELENSYLQGCHLCTILWIVSLRHESAQHKIHFTDLLREAKDLAVVIEPVFWSSFYCSLYLTTSMRGAVHESTLMLLSLDFLSLNSSTNGLPAKKASKFTPKIPANRVGGKILTRDSRTGEIRDWLRRKAFGDAASGSPTVVTPIPVLTSSLPLKTLSHKILQQTMNWVNGCVASHAKCNTPTDGVLPARLIDLKDVQQLQLVRIVRVPVRSSPDLKYATLSYCWGGKSKLQLNRSNASTLEVGVSVSTLPKTIQDAVHFTAALGLRWLWVDSLCIVQDSTEDMAHEVQSMYSIYQNCFISIAALDAEHSDAGLYACRDPLMYADCELARISEEQAIFINSGPSYGSNERVPPLFTRGWVVQERILPPRTVVFGRTVAWECRETRLMEFKGAERTIPGRTIPLSIKLDFFNAVTESKGKLAATDNELVKIREAWSHILSEYVKTNLTFKSDRLAAISAIISAIQARTNWQNSVGLWVPFLFTELLWKRGPRTSGSTGISPSWSWASVDGGITLLPLSDTILKRFVEVDIEDGDVECLKTKNVSSGGRLIALRVSGTPMRFRTDGYDFEGEDAVPKEPYMLQALPNIFLHYGWIPDIYPEDDYPSYFLPFAQLESALYGGVVGLASTATGLKIMCDFNAGGFHLTIFGVELSRRKVAAIASLTVILARSLSTSSFVFKYTTIERYSLSIDIFLSHCIF
ncbi:HET-domain-containing protein [Hyaloscypha hepaticicola]|uniref:HET-domain-containing protein n=1 Tax=Hyaloscypha hepaticicola TaxID=2082293 RepID=A0A2J6PRX4_9HELO|nr:HET-domain-containing protein [Hyaloscypha hepaticicola]